MNRLKHSLAHMSLGRKLVLAGSLLALLSIFMPWHSIGTPSIGTQHVYNGLGDQNFVIGLLVLVFSLCSLCMVGLPLLGMRVPRLKWRESVLLTFFGGESLLLTLVLTGMHQTSVVRAVSFDLRIGLYFAIIGSALIFAGGLLQGSREADADADDGSLSPLTRVRHHTTPTTPHSETLHQHHTAVQDSRVASREDMRMKLDL